MDALSRFLAQIGRDLGEGLTKVGETFLQREAQRENILLQSLEKMRQELFNQYREAMKLPGFQVLSDDERNEFQKMLVRLSVPGAPMDQETFKLAIDGLARVSSYSGTLTSIQELFRQGKLDDVGLLIVDMDENAARRLLSAINAESMYPSLRARGEEAKLMRQLTTEEAKERLALLRKQREKLGADIRYLDALVRKTDAETEKLLAEAGIAKEQLKNLAEQLRLAQKKTEAEIQRLLADTKKAETELTFLPDLLQAQIREILSKSGLNEAQVQLVLAQARKEEALVEQIKAATQHTLALVQKTVAETRLTEVQTALKETEREFLRSRLEAELTLLGQQIRKGEIDLEFARQEAELKIKDLLASIGLKESQAKLIAAQTLQTFALIQKIEADIQQTLAYTGKLLADTEYVKTLTEKEREELKALPAKLQAQLDLLRSEAQMKAIDAANWEQRWKLTLQEMLLNAGLKQAQIDEIMARIENTRAHTLYLQANADNLRALTEKVKVETALEQEKQRWQQTFQGSQAATQILGNLMNILKDMPDASEEEVRELVRTMFTPLEKEGVKFDQEALVKSLTKTLERARQGADLAYLAQTLKIEESKLGLLDNLMDRFSELAASGNAEAAWGAVRSTAARVFGVEVAEALREVFLDIHESNQFLRRLNLGADLIQKLSSVAPTDEKQLSQFLRGTYDYLQKEYGTNYANAIINAIKEMVRNRKEATQLALAGKRTEEAREKAQTKLLEAQALLALAQAEKTKQNPEHQEELLRIRQAILTLKEQELGLAWERLRLEREKLEDSLKNVPEYREFASFLNTLGGSIEKAREQLIQALKLHPDLGDCRNFIEDNKNSLIEIAASDQAPGPACAQKIYQIINNLRGEHRNSEADRRVASLYRNYQTASQAYLNLLASFATGDPTSVIPRREGDKGERGTIGQPTGLGAPGFVSGVRNAAEFVGGKAAASMQRYGGELRKEHYGAAALLSIGEGGPLENPVQIKPSSGVKPQVDAACQKYLQAKDYAAYGACQMKELVARARGNNQAIWGYNVAHLGAMHMWPAFISNGMTSRMKPEAARQQPAVLDFVARARRIDRQALADRGELFGVDVGAYYAYNAMEAYKDYLSAKGVKFAAGEAGQRTMVLLAYGLAFVPTIGSRSSDTGYEQAILKAARHLGLTFNDDDPEFKKKLREMTEVLERLDNALTPRAIGEWLAARR